GYRPARAERRPAFDVHLPGGLPGRGREAAPNGSHLLPAGAGGSAGASGNIAAAAAELRQGATTCGRLVADSLEAVERRDPSLRAVVHLMADEAAGRAGGPGAER